MNATQLARTLDVSDRTVGRWIRSGRIRGRWITARIKGNSSGYWEVDPIESPKHYSTAKRYAFLRKIPVETVLWRCRKGKIAGAVKIGDCWRIPDLPAAFA